MEDHGNLNTQLATATGVRTLKIIATANEIGADGYVSESIS